MGHFEFMPAMQGGGEMLWWLSTDGLRLEDGIERNVLNLGQGYSWRCRLKIIIIEPEHMISNNEACATSKASDQPAHMRSLIRAFYSRLSIL